MKLILAVFSIHTQKKMEETAADVIILDSSDEDVPNRKVTPRSHRKVDARINNKRKNGNCEVLSTKPTKRIKPLQISGVVSLSTDPESHFNFVNNNTEDIQKTERLENTSIIIEDAPKTKEPSPASPPPTETPDKKQNKPEIEIVSFFAKFLEACRKADPAPDMELLINKKLIRYYKYVHPDFINSKSFRKNVESVTEDIDTNPGLVYLKITGIIEELKIRKKSNNTVMANEEVTTTGNEKRDKQLKKLNKALYILKKKIAVLEEEEVDFEEDLNSSYLMVERHKKRAWEIYEKICDITGESKHAHRSVRKPIHFTGTTYPEFNKAIQTFVNRSNSFPDYVDVFKCLEYCNQKYNFTLKTDAMKKIAADAFTKIGKLLKNRRQADLYETVTYFIGVDKDPANEDKDLLSKLSQNKVYHSRISDIIDKYAEEQEHKDDDPAEDGIPNNDENKAAVASGSKPVFEIEVRELEPPTTITEMQKEEEENNSVLNGATNQTEIENLEDQILIRAAKECERDESVISTSGISNIVVLDDDDDDVELRSKDAKKLSVS